MLRGKYDNYYKSVVQGAGKNIVEISSYNNSIHNSPPNERKFAPQVQFAQNSRSQLGGATTQVEQ